MALPFQPRRIEKFFGHKASSLLRLAAFCLGGSALAWLVISHSLVAYLSTRTPELASSIRGNDSQALLLLAEKDFKAIAQNKDGTFDKPRLSKSRLIELREKVASALVANPLSSRAYLLLGQIAELEGSATTAEKFMYAAAQRSLHESFAIYWMMRRSVERKNYQSAAYYADVLLRSNPGVIAYVAPTLAQMADDPDAEPLLVKLLATNPKWRPAYFHQIGDSAADPRTPYRLLSSLQESAAPPTRDELNAYEAFLFQRGLYDLAYEAWLRFLPPDRLRSAGFLFNGDFAKKPTGSQFNWQVSPGVNVVVDFASRPDDAKNRALVIDFGPGRVEFPGVSQFTMLPPGAYTLKGRYMGDIRGPRGVQWSARCVGGAPLGQSQVIIGSQPGWRAFEFPVVVPEKDCAAQKFELKLAARSPSEKLLFGVLWFDDMSISRAQSASN